MYGATNEYMIFPIMEIVSKEIRKVLTNGSIERVVQQVNNGQGQGYIPDPSGSTVDIVYDKNILNALESNDYEVTFEKKDPDNPKLLTAVIINYGEYLKQVLNLIRSGGKLTAVKINVVKKEPISRVTPNPYNMSGQDFVDYVRNKRKWEYYKLIAADTGNTQEEVEAAKTQMEYLELRNEELRNVYLVDPLDDMPYEQLLEFLPNPLAMDKSDFVLYMKNKRIGLREHPAVTDAIVSKAMEGNNKLRDRYFIDEDVYSYAELKPYLPNPAGLQDEDFVAYMDNKAQWTELVETTIPDLEDRVSSETDPVVKAALQAELNSAIALKDQLVDRNVEIRDANYVNPTGAVSGYNDSYSSLLPYIPKDDSLYSEKVLFNILISLLYNGSGKLEKVTSETGV